MIHFIWPNLLLFYHFQILLLLLIYDINGASFGIQYDLNTVTPCYENLTKMSHRTLTLMASRKKWQYIMGNFYRKQHDLLKTVWRKPTSADVEIVLDTQKSSKVKRNSQNIYQNSPIATQNWPEFTTPNSMIEFYYMHDHVNQKDGKNTKGNLSVFRVEDNNHSLFAEVFEKYPKFPISKASLARFTTLQQDLKITERKLERVKPKMPRAAKYPNKNNLMHSLDLFPTDLPIKRVTIYQTPIIIPITTKKSPPYHSNNRKKSKKSLRDDRSRLYVSENKTLGSFNIEAVHQRYPFKYHYQATVRSLTEQIENNPDEYRLYQNLHHRVNAETESILEKFTHTTNYKLNASVVEVPSDTNKINGLPIMDQQLNETHGHKTTDIPSDKVKFFEMYDENTIKPTTQTKPAQLPNLNQTYDIFSHVSFNKSSKTTYTEIPHYKMYSVDISDQATTLNTSFSTIRFPKRTKESSWSKYTYLAVYSYEPLTLHCDAAILSPHWLVTTGACLYRRQLDQPADPVSAFVTYCGPNWRDPERVVYVKYSVVHPRFHPRDQTRKHLYNIGLIQVPDSTTATCHKWSSLSLVTHSLHYTSGLGSATAVGWGLDRFHEATIDAAPSYFSSYSSVVYTGSCPGNRNYESLKNIMEGRGGIKNVYCLALPPYSSDVTDPVHGSLLISGGKLVALYLEEERYPTGDQSAQYTGVWSLAPWVTSVAKENEVFNHDSVLLL